MSRLPSLRTFVFRCVTIIFAACAGLVSPAAAAPPPNDDFANSTAIGPTPAIRNGTTNGATYQPGEPPTGTPNGGNTVWWRFIPTESGTYVVTTDGSSFDTVLNIYTGAALNTLVSVTANDDDGVDKTSRIKFALTAGTTYHIRVRGYELATGNILLRVFGPSPANDDFASRVTIAAFGTVAGNNTGASFEPGEPMDRGNSVWWRFTPAQSGPLRVNTSGSQFDTVLQVFTGNVVNTLTQVAANDDSGNSKTSEVNFNATAGTSYSISVKGFGLKQGPISVLVGPGADDGLAKVVAAVSPVARATLSSTPATAFATMLNSGTTTATGCRPWMVPNPPVIFSYRPRNHLTGELGLVEGAANIPPGGRQDFLLTFQGNGDVTKSLVLPFDCTNTEQAPTHLGLNTFLLTTTSAPAPADIIATTATTAGNGVLTVPQGGTGFAGIASINIGTAANLQLTLSPAMVGGSAPALPATITICRTHPVTAACQSPPAAPPINFSATKNQTVTFSAFVKSNGTPINYDPATKRLFVHFYQGGLPVGSTSVAVHTVAPAGGATQATASAR